MKGGRGWADIGSAPGDVPWPPRNLLVPYLLFALSFYRAHGYVLQQWLRALGFFGVDLTTLYRTLRQMERQGLVSSAWDAEQQGPARRVYTLTDVGRLMLESWAAALGPYRLMLEQFARTYYGTEPSFQAPQEEHEASDKGRRQGDESPG